MLEERHGDCRRPHDGRLFRGLSCRISLAPVSNLLLRKGLVVEQLKVENGKLALPRRLGRATELNQAVVAEFTVDGNCMYRKVVREEGVQ